MGVATSSKIFKGASAIDLFDKNSTEKDSDIFYVPYGTNILLQAFGLTYKPREYSEAGKIKPPRLQYAYVNQAIVADVSACENCTENGYIYRTSGLPIADSNLVNQCGLWSLNKFQNIGILAIPGWFFLSLDDSSIGNVTIRATAIPVNFASTFPVDLYFGKRN